MSRIILFPVLFTISLLSMLGIDYWLGTRAEFVNAWSVVERILGIAPTAGDSFIFLRFGAAGEFISVLIANVAIGILLTLLISRINIRSHG